MNTRFIKREFSRSCFLRHMVNTESAVITPPRILLDWLTRGLHRFAWELEDTVVRNGGSL